MPPDSKPSTSQAGEGGGLGSCQPLGSCMFLLGPTDAQPGGQVPSLRDPHPTAVGMPYLQWCTGP